MIYIDADKPPLLAGFYAVDLWFGDRMANRIDRIDGAFEFEVITAADREVGPPFAGGFGYTGSFYYPSKWTRISGPVAGQNSASKLPAKHIKAQPPPLATMLPQYLAADDFSSLDDIGTLPMRLPALRPMASRNDNGVA